MSALPGLFWEQWPLLWLCIKARMFPLTPKWLLYSLHLTRPCHSFVATQWIQPLPSTWQHQDTVYRTMCFLCVWIAVLLLVGRVTNNIPLDYRSVVGDSFILGTRLYHNAISCIKLWTLPWSPLVCLWLVLIAAKDASTMNSRGTALLARQAR